MHWNANGVEHWRPKASLHPCIKHLWDAVVAYRHGHIVCSTGVQHKTWQWHRSTWAVGPNSSLVSYANRSRTHFPVFVPIKVTLNAIMGTGACWTTNLRNWIWAWVWAGCMATFVLKWSVFDRVVVMMFLIGFSGAGAWWPITLLWDDLAFQRKALGDVVFKFINVCHAVVFSCQHWFTGTSAEWWATGKPVHSWCIWHVATANTLIQIITVLNHNWHGQVTTHRRSRLWGTDPSCSNSFQRWRTERSYFTSLTADDFVYTLRYCCFPFCFKLPKSTCCEKILQVFIWAGWNHHSIRCGEERQNGVTARRWAAEGCGRPCHLLSFQLHLNAMFVISQCVWKNKQNGLTLTLCGKMVWHPSQTLPVVVIWFYCPVKHTVSPQDRYPPCYVLNYSSVQWTITHKHEHMHIHDCTRVCNPPPPHTHTHTKNICITGDGLAEKRRKKLQISMLKIRGEF